MNWAWTLNTYTLADTVSAPDSFFSSWRELLAVGLLGVGFILLLGTLGAMWRGRWREPARSASSRLDRPTSLELESSNPTATDFDSAFSVTQTGSDQIDAVAPSLPRVSPSRPAIPEGLAERSLPAVGAPSVTEAQALFNAMNQAEDQAARLSAGLDEKLSALRQVITQAEAKITELNAATSIASEKLAAVASASAAPRSAPAPAPVVTIAARRPEALVSTAAAMHTPPPPTPTPTPHARTSRSPGVLAEPVPTSTQVPTLVAVDPAGPDPLTGEIYRLADQGIAHVEIARRLNQHVGKVELILALRPG